MCGGKAGVDVCGVCGGTGVQEGFCDCAKNVKDCDKVCGGTKKVDECNTCGGNGPAPGKCDCAGNVKGCDG